MPFLPQPGAPRAALVQAVAPLIQRVGNVQITLLLPDGGLKAGDDEIVVRVSPDAGPPTLSLAMPAMAMMKIAPPTLRPGARPGETRVALAFPHGGRYRLTLRLSPPAGKPLVATFDLDVRSADEDAMSGMDMGGMTMGGMKMGAMGGVLGPWSMAREGSGTSWLPDDSPMFMKDLGTSGRYSIMYMGDFSLNYTDSNVSRGRGPHEFFSNSMPMLMARRDLSGGATLGFRIMGSLDPLFNGEYGAPNLLQTGETAHGHDLVDRQHPHDLIAEVSTTYSRPIGGGTRGFVYLAPIGEPALGGSMYLMRPSGMEIPEAPITHHWFDSTHIAFGVATAGLTFGDRWKVEGSAFKGREPDENRYVPDGLGLDSGSARVTYNPSRALSMSVSYGSLHSPEGQTPNEDEARTTAAIHYGRLLRSGDAFAATAYFGRDAHEGHVSDAYLAEASFFHRDWTTYLRYENVAKDELTDVPEGIYHVGKFVFGATRDFAHPKGFDIGVGAYAGLYVLPSDLSDAYGKTPVSLGVYLRLRPSQMRMDGAKGGKS